MPRLTMTTAHALGQDEAMRRLKAKFSAARAAYGAKVNDLLEEWQENVLSFGFKVMGMKVAGTVAVEAAEVKMNADLPLAAMMFKGAIEKQVRAELGNLLA